MMMAVWLATWVAGVIGHVCRCGVHEAGDGGGWWQELVVVSVGLLPHVSLPSTLPPSNRARPTHDVVNSGGHRVACLSRCQSCSHLALH